ncbi:Cationic amino acid transporter 4 [Desmophyllum pertusum]|uniref:Cationic amino acid transporter 4 n=1 Tax=Desmophyllum pertusum TaxID=174260 RepID=A0A9W9ZDK8_9CNID|nr:Cationic amino acid transporter 4 [Desmophyllum pertusum]
MACQRLRDNLTRKKSDEVCQSDSLLRRCLTTIDLTSLGVGTVIGAGLYVVTGELARDIAGPAVVLSFLLASISAMLCASFYAEFGCRIPKAGSAYIYTYVALGEIWAFVVGWNIILEYIIAGASLARACSEYIDTVFHGEIYHFFMNDIATWNYAAIGPFPDFLAFGLVVAVVILVCLGTRLSANVQKVLAAGNFLVILFMIVYGLFFANFENWTKDFAPYGTRGVLRGAASAFYAFGGFDVITTAAEEAVNPQTNIPLSLILTVTISTMAYFGVATTLTLMLPYHQLDAFAPLAQAFAQGNFPAAKYIIAVGGICATISALVCAVFSPSRIVYSMSVDGLLFRWFSHVNDKTHAPVRATITAGCLTALMAMIFDINQLVELLSIGTLLAYTMVAISVLTAAYQPITDEEKPLNDNDDDFKREANESTAFCVKLSVFFLVAGIAGLAVVLTYSFEYIAKGEWWAIFLICLFSGTIIVSLVAIQLQPRNSATFPFMVPGVPYIPAITIFINAVLMANLHWTTYVRFGVWMILGFILYLFYGYQHSTEAIKPANQQEGEFFLPETPSIQSIVNKPQITLK